jgi:predicted transcriptional regulator
LPYAPFATAFIAFCAFCTAIVAIYMQTLVARRRAAIDFFLKTDLDQNMLDAHRDFERTVKTLKARLAAGETVKTFEDTNEDDYRKILRYLNIHELIAVGIKNRVFDGDVCYNYWSDELVRHANDAKAVIDHEIESEGVPSAAFLQLRWLSIKWAKRAQVWRDKQG